MTALQANPYLRGFEAAKDYDILDEFPYLRQIHFDILGCVWVVDGNKGLSRADLNELCAGRHSLHNISNACALLKKYSLLNFYAGKWYRAMRGNVALKIAEALRDRFTHLKRKIQKIWFPESYKFALECEERELKAMALLNKIEEENEWGSEDPDTTSTYYVDVQEDKGISLFTRLSNILNPFIFRRYNPI